MQKTIKLLGIILLVQLTIVAILQLPGISGSPEAVILLTAEERTSIDEVIIEAQNGDEKVVLKKVAADRWEVPELYNLKANASLIEKLLKRLEELELGWPVATTSSAKERFEVDQANYQRKVTMKAGDKILHTLYLGSSPGLRKLHARLDGSDDIYSVRFALYDLYFDADSWFDRSILQPEGEITALKTDNIDLSGEPNNLVLADLPDDKQTNVNEVNKLVSKFKNLIVMSILPESAQKTFAAQKPVKSYQVKTADEEISYDIYTGNDGQEAYGVVKASKHELFYKLSTTIYEMLMQADRDTLMHELGAEPEVDTFEVLPPVSPIPGVTEGS